RSTRACERRRSRALQSVNGSRVKTTMRTISWLSMALAGLIAAAPARAGGPPDLISPFDAQLVESLISPRALLGDVVTERDLARLLAHVRAAILAAAAGAAPPPVPAELNQRAEVIGKALRARGTVAALVLLDALEASARQRLRELPKQPPLPPAAAGAPGSI